MYSKEEARASHRWDSKECNGDYKRIQRGKGQRRPEQENRGEASRHHSRAKKTVEERQAGRGQQMEARQAAEESKTGKKAEPIREGRRA